jgi:hypothetical protein
VSDQEGVALEIKPWRVAMGSDRDEEGVTIACSRVVVAMTLAKKV